MYVCSCNVFTDADVRAVALTAGSVAGVYRCLGCTPQCGVCARTIRKLMAEARAQVDCGCETMCAPNALDCPAVERALEIVRSFDLDDLTPANALPAE